MDVCTFSPSALLTYLCLFLETQSKKKESVTFTKVQKKVSITHQGKCKIKFRKKLHESGPVRDTPSTKNRDVTFHIHIHILFSFI